MSKQSIEEVELVTAFTPGPYLRDGRTVYALQGTGRFSGKGADYAEDQENRFVANIQGNKAPEGELEAVAQLFAAAPTLYAATRDALTEFRRMRDEHPDEWDRIVQTSTLIAWDRLRAALALASPPEEAK